MKKVIIFLLVPALFYQCTEKTNDIAITTLHPGEFNSASFALPDVPKLDSLKQSHDSCMGFSFDANAMLINRSDLFFVGDIINKQSLKVINRLQDLGLTQAQLMSQFNVLTNPCYEKRALNLPLKTLLGDTFALHLPNVAEFPNKEINDAISSSRNADMQTGSWVYLDMTDALQHILDTTQQATAQQYREHLLDTANMVLTSVESVTDVSFLIHTAKDISQPLQAALQSKPLLKQPASQSSLQLFYINNNTFQITLNGFFPVVGRFAKAERK